MTFWGWWLLLRVVLFAYKDEPLGDRKIRHPY
ncbi:Uncharacterised protein [Chlamydia abortus]|nr:Uncharacterised protein [Chlamydia abortus]